jgi:hypothetical protein
MLYVFCLFGFAKNGIMPFHHWLPGAMVAPTPVSALLHAVAVVKVGVFCTTRVMLYVFGIDLMADLNLGVPTAYFVGFTIIAASIIALIQGQPQGAAGLLHGEPAELYHHGGGAADACRHSGRTHPYRQSRLCQDHAVFLCRRHLCGRPS